MTFVDDTDFSTCASTEPVCEFLRSQNFLGTKAVRPLRAERTSAFRREDE